MRGQFNTLTEVAQAVEQLEAQKYDYVPYCGQMAMTTPDYIKFNQQEYIITNYAHRQLASRLDIPKQYYDRIQSVKGLREYNVNALLDSKPEDKLLVRTYQQDGSGVARAFLSDRYKVILLDYSMMMAALLPAIQGYLNGNGNKILIKTGAITDSKFYLQLRFPNLYAPVKEGDVVCRMLTLVDSEVGAAAFDVKKSLEILRCSNGMIGESVLRKYHVGRRINGDDEDFRFYADDTMRAEMKSLRLRLRDVMKHALVEEEFMKEVKVLQEADQTPMTGTVKDVVENVTQHYGFNKHEGELVLDNVIKGGEFTKWGLSNGITALAQQIEDCDRQFELERVGAKVIDLNTNQWKSLQEEVNN